MAENQRTPFGLLGKQLKPAESTDPQSDINRKANSRIAIAGIVAAVAFSALKAYIAPSSTPTSADAQHASAESAEQRIAMQVTIDGATHSVGTGKALRSLLLQHPNKNAHITIQQPLDLSTLEKLATVNHGGVIFLNLSRGFLPQDKQKIHTRLSQLKGRVQVIQS